MLWHEEHLWNFGVLQGVHIYSVVSGIHSWAVLGSLVGCKLLITTLCPMKFRK